MRTLKNFFRIDFNEYKNWLLSLSSGDLTGFDKETLVEALNKLDPVVDTKGSWDLEKVENGKVIFAGINNTNLPTNPMFTNVVGSQLDETSRVYLHFGRK